MRCMKQNHMELGLSHLKWEAYIHVLAQSTGVWEASKKISFKSNINTNSKICNIFFSISFWSFPFTDIKSWLGPMPLKKLFLIYCIFSDCQFLHGLSCPQLPGNSGHKLKPYFLIFPQRCREIGCDTHAEKCPGNISHTNENSESEGLEAPERCSFQPTAVLKSISKEIHQTVVNTKQ